MSSEQQVVKIEHRFKLEKRTDDGELFETVEFTADENGRVTDTKVVQRKTGMAPPDAYAPIETNSQE